MGTNNRRVDPASGRIIYKTVEQENGTLRFFGANRWARLNYCHSGEHKGDSFFMHYKRKYYLGEFTRTKKGD